MPILASLWCAGWIFAAYGYGTALLGDLIDRKEPAGYFLYKVLTVAIGLFLVSLLILAAAALGFLRKEALWVIFAVGMALWAKDKARWGKAELGHARGLWAAASTLDRVIILAIGSLILSTFIASHAPAIGNDALSYHLYFARLHAEAGHLVYDPYHPRSVWPSMMGMLYAAGLILQGTALAQLFAWLTAVLGVLAVPAAAAYTYRNAAVTRSAAVLMGLVPAIWMQSVYGYVDNTVMTYAFLSFTCLWLLKRGFHLRMAVAAGLCLGALLSVKILSLMIAAGLAAVFLPYFVLAPYSPGAKLKAAAVVLGAAALTAGFWYVRSWLLTGNPVYPFLPGIFHSGFAQRVAGFTVLPRNVWMFLALPWNLTFLPAVFGGERLGGLFLAALPLAVFAPRVRGMARAAGLFALVFIVCWFMTAQVMRFFLTAVPFLALFFACAAAEWRPGPAVSGILKAALVPILVLQFALCHYYPYRMLSGALGLLSRDAYLEKHERTYRFMKKVGEHVGREDKVLYLNEPRLFYAPSRALTITPAVDAHLAGHRLSFADWLDKENIRYLAARSMDGRKPSFESVMAGRTVNGRAEEVFSMPVHSDLPYVYTLWRIVG